MGHFDSSDAYAKIAINWNARFSTFSNFLKIFSKKVGVRIFRDISYFQAPFLIESERKIHPKKVAWKKPFARQLEEKIQIGLDNDFIGHHNRRSGYYASNEKVNQNIRRYDSEQEFNDIFHYRHSPRRVIFRHIFQLCELPGLKLCSQGFLLSVRFLNHSL